MNKASAGIELVTSQSTCAIECPHCRFTQDVEAQDNSLDENAKITFDTLQEFLTLHNIERFFTYAFPLKGNITNRLPEILDISLLTRINIGFGQIKERHESNTEIVAKQTIDKLEFLLSNISSYNSDSLEGKGRIGLFLSYGPKELIISQNEHNLIKEVYNLYRPFVTNHRYAYGEISFDSNMVSGEHINKNISALQQEQAYFKEELYRALKESSDKKNYVVRQQESFTDIDLLGSRVYKYNVSMENEGSSFSFKRRLIAKTKKDTIEKQMELAASYLNYEIIESVAIYPHGVLINHSSLEVNNPFLWVSHDRFRDALKTNKRSKNIKNISFPRLLNSLVEENVKDFFYFKEFTEEHTALVAKSVLHKTL